LADDIKLFLDALEIDKVTLIGTCLGGYVSGVFAARYPEKLENLILVGAMSMLGGAHLFSKDNFPK
jgi:pimeloyl-ACP methyl ester carboxylesterase